MTNEEKSSKGLLIAVVILISLAVVVLMGGAVIGQFSIILRTQTTANAVQFALPQNGTSTAVGTTGQYPYLQSVTDPCTNTTNSSITYDIGNYTVNLGTEDGGTVSLPAAGADANEGRTVNCTISYLADSAGQAAADNFESGLSIFGIFAAILALAIVGLVIMRFFKGDKESAG